MTSFDADVVLRDGSTVHLRRLRQTDVAKVMDFFERLSEESRYFRFFTSRQVDEALARQLVDTDNVNRVGLAAELGDQIIGLAHYYRVAAAQHGSPAAQSPRSQSAEVAFAIADAFHGRGIGTRLLEQLADIARLNGIREFEAYVLGENRKMLDVFLESGFRVSQRIEGGVFHVTLSLAADAAFREKAAARALTAATASMKVFFEPRAVAVVGANRERGKLGAEIFHNLRDAGFTGRLVPVHPRAVAIDGVPAFPRVSDIPDPIDLAVIVVPAREVEAVVDDCVAKGVRGVVVISAGFSETGDEGRVRERALVEKIRAAGIRMIGPNCMGIVNTDPGVRLNATFARLSPAPGRVAMATQSGALGLAILDYMTALNLGISTFVSMGNKADVSGNDLIQYWAQDPRTDVILLYLESFGNPRKFGQIAPRVARSKPIVAVKAGRSTAGARAASSHTGALASSDAIVEALFKQAGVIRTRTLEEMFDVAVLLANQPPPRGPRVAILTNAGGPAILAADACEAQGLEIPPLGEATVRALRGFLPPAASTANPVDMIASASADQYARAMRVLLADEQVDSLIVIFIPPISTEADRVAAAIVDAAAAANGKPVVANFLSARGTPPTLAPVPCYLFPESAATALAQAWAYAAWRNRPAGAPARFEDIQTTEARTIVDRVIARGGGWLRPLEAQKLLMAARIPVAETIPAATEDEAAAIASRLGFPVVVKAVGPSIVHKTDVGGVCLDLRTTGDVRTAYQELARRLGDRLTGVTLQRMAPPGAELLIGATEDPTFGPLLACGTGGVMVEVLRDTVFRMHPLTDIDAADMLQEIRGAALLRGVRGQPPRDEAAVREALLRLSALIDICPEIREVDINPVRVFERGLLALDARVHVERPAPKPVSRRVTY